VGVLWDVLDLHARHSAIMALRAPFRNRTRIPPVSPRPGSCTIRACSRHSCGPLLTDPGKLAAIVAGPFGIVRPPPAARPAHPVVAAEDTPRQAPFARARLLGASGVAAGAQALAEIALGRAALDASWWGERPTGQTGVAVVNPGGRPGDPVGLAAGAHRRWPQRCPRPRGRRTHNGGSDFGLPNRGVTIGDQPWPAPSPALSSLTVSVVRGRRAATLSGSGVIRSGVLLDPRVDVGHAKVLHGRARTSHPRHPGHELLVHRGREGLRCPPRLFADIAPVALHERPEDLAPGQLVRRVHQHAVHVEDRTLKSRHRHQSLGRFVYDGNPAKGDAACWPNETRPDRDSRARPTD